MANKEIEVLADKFKGKMVLTIKKQTWTEAAKDFRWAAVLKLATGESFSVTAISAILKKAWKMPTGVTFEEINGNMAVLKFEDKLKLEKVLEEGPWTYQNQLILIKRWEFGRKPEDLEFSKVQVWVQMHGIPVELMTEKISMGIAETIGKVCRKMPEETEVRKKKFARYKVEIEVKEPIKNGVYVALEDADDEPFWVEFKFERLPSPCELCKVITHETINCTKKHGDDENALAENSEKREPRVAGVVEESESIPSMVQPAPQQDTIGTATEAGWKKQGKENQLMGRDRAKSK
ncbi:hypothetical protein QQ045_005682 [Rhodiola kirilowii]